MRKLAVIKKIDEIRQHDNADLLEIAIIGGWRAVVKKNEFSIGEHVIYIEIDSWVPTELASFLSKGKTPKIYEGISGERLRTIKLRGQISQGLVLKNFLNAPLGADVTEILNIKKWEAPVSGGSEGISVGSFPTHIMPKTDQERVQNIDLKNFKTHIFEVTTKLDGSSCTIFKLNGEMRVCSRNLELKICKENENNNFVKMAKRLSDKLSNLDNIAFQGELMGPGIQGNREKLSSIEFYVYDVLDLSDGFGKKATAEARQELIARLELNHVPIISNGTNIIDETVESILDYADTIKSINNNIAEGIVYKSMIDPNVSFKAISNKYLLNGGN